MARRSETFYLASYRSPLGNYIVYSSDYGVTCITPEENLKTSLVQWKKNGIRIREGAVQNQKVIEQLEAYFSGYLKHFDLPLDLRGTFFQLWVWRLLQHIPYGETRSYGDIAHAVGRPGAARAIGGAVGANPVSIVVPCHRVIGSHGDLVGYGGGLTRKQGLLDMEAKALRKASQSEPKEL